MLKRSNWLPHAGLRSTWCSPGTRRRLRASQTAATRRTADVASATTQPQISSCSTCARLTLPSDSGPCARRSRDPGLSPIRSPSASVRSSDQAGRDRERRAGTMTRTPRGSSSARLAHHADGNRAPPSAAKRRQLHDRRPLRPSHWSGVPVVGARRWPAASVGTSRCVAGCSALGRANLTVSVIRVVRPVKVRSVMSAKGGSRRCCWR